MTLTVLEKIVLFILDIRLWTGRPIAQMGSVLPLPAELLNGNYAIQFWPETGAIKSVTKNQ